MIVLLSPSKTQDFSEIDHKFDLRKPVFSKLSKELVSELQKCSVKQVEKLMSVSSKIANLNVQRYKDYSDKYTTKNSKPALLAFKGDVYRGFNLDDYKKSDYKYADNCIRIISGLYGYVKPLDFIQAYRLEMKTKLKSKNAKDLYSFWGSKIAEEIKKDSKSKKSRLVVNLASNEYSKAIDKSILSNEWIDIAFKEKKGDDYKIVAIYAKRARGLMADFIVRNRSKSAKDLKSFTVEGYKFKASMSDDSQLVFVR